MAKSKETKLVVNAAARGAFRWRSAECRIVLRRRAANVWAFVIRRELDDERVVTVTLDHNGTITDYTPRTRLTNALVAEIPSRLALLSTPWAIEHGQALPADVGQWLAETLATYARALLDEASDGVRLARLRDEGAAGLYRAGQCAEVAAYLARGAERVWTGTNLDVADATLLGTQLAAAQHLLRGRVSEVAPVDYRPTLDAALVILERGQ